MNLCARTGLIAVYALGAPEKYDSQKRLGKGVERKKPGKAYQSACRSEIWVRLVVAVLHRLDAD
jgi:hypothetical protein